jgi:hypothetical protein
MHVVFECLPLSAGLLVLLFYRYTKSFPLKAASWFLLPLLSALLANQLSNEGVRYLYLDVLQANASAFVFFLLSRSFAKRSS